MENQPEITAKQKRAFIAVGMLSFGDLVLFSQYLFDLLTIQCEPCAPKVYCPPCQTDFMGLFWWALLGWNVVGIALIYYLSGKR